MTEKEKRREMPKEKQRNSVESSQKRRRFLSRRTRTTTKAITKNDRWMMIPILFLLRDAIVQHLPLSDIQRILR